MPEYVARAFFVCHSSRLSDEAVVTVTSEAPPTAEEVTPLIWAEASAVIQRRAGEPGYEVEMQEIRISPAEG